MKAAQKDIAQRLARLVGDELTEQVEAKIRAAVEAERKRGDERVEAERAAIVAWLRAGAEEMFLRRLCGDGESRMLEVAADAIERGEDREGGAE